MAAPIYPSKIGDWSNYGQHRPPYPPSLTKLIMDYHRAHSNSLRLAHDMGSGSGVFVPTLANYFQHVLVSDPSAGAISQARQHLSAFHSTNWWKGRFTFAVTPAEKADMCVADRSVDMVTMMEAAHLVDADGMIESAANQLAPNGTLALVCYSPAFRVIDNDKVHEATRELLRAWTEEVIRSFGGEESLAYTRVYPQNQVGLDFVSLPEKAFIQDVTKRININTHGHGTKNFRIPGVEHLLAASKVGREQRLYEYSEVDEEGKGWQQDVDASWFRGFVSSLAQEEKLHLYEEHFREVEKAVAETSQSGKVRIEWPVAVLLATRNM